jgi:hypothetical protein
LEKHRWDICPTAVYGEVAVGDKQARLVPAVGITQTENDVVEAGFERLEERQAGNPTFLQRSPVVSTKLAFQDTIYSAGFLLSSQLACIIRFAPTAELTHAPVLARRESPSLKGTLWCEAAVAFEEEFLAFPAAKFTY